MVLPIFTHSFTFSFPKRFQVITVVKMVFSCLALRHKTGGSANNALPIKKIDNHSSKTGGTINTH
ncbi:hypothetical protein EWN99_20255 [Salmonella enterica]|uniref:Uncharacterized protein n=2 Tax=Salmonella enterica subsp. salamae TaxID=59202 RepID=A0A5Y3MVE4_SALER|nr:hypothetical protein DOE57_15310 [Salmonella enterica subsp. salamae serovar 56:b:[1,5]]EAB2012203.1 hypothetical protein [Salmonella enterica]ECE6361555.1 hypothetical protein [Salmonella enterica subsp. salamae]HAC6507214.1 hypothetical protein [Salmonella enterica subsp. salamae serovar 30:1,z28:z6]EAR6709024.1 hypothetical protein [Salmonella enterica]